MATFLNIFTFLNRDAESLKAWRAICEKSRIEFQQASSNDHPLAELPTTQCIAVMELVILCYDLFLQVYDMLGVTGLEERGESFYNPFLPSLVVQFLHTYIHTYMDSSF